MPQPNEVWDAPFPDWLTTRCSRERCFGGRPRRGNLSVGCLTADECDRDGDNIGVGAVRLHGKGHAHLADDREVFRYCLAAVNQAVIGQRLD
jgi:hypothetical protein